MTIGDRMIQSSFAEAFHECNRIMALTPDNQGNVSISPLNSDKDPLTYVTHDRARYCQYRILQALRKSIFDNPSFTENADDPYSYKQYEKLLSLFSNESDEQALKQYGLSKDLIDHWNAILSKGKKYNWLRDQTHWIFAHGPEAPICRPWPTQ